MNAERWRALPGCFPSAARSLVPPRQRHFPSFATRGWCYLLLLLLVAFRLLWLAGACCNQGQANGPMPAGVSTCTVTQNRAAGGGRCSWAAGMLHLGGRATSRRSENTGSPRANDAHKRRHDARRHGAHVPRYSESVFVAGPRVRVAVGCSPARRARSVGGVTTRCTPWYRGLSCSSVRHDAASLRPLPRRLHHR
jgi:hypothetical protein